MPLPVTGAGKGQARRRWVPLASNNGALEPGSSRDTHQILEVPGQPVAAVVSEDQSPSLASQPLRVIQDALMFTWQGKSMGVMVGGDGSSCLRKATASAREGEGRTRLPRCL